MLKCTYTRSTKCGSRKLVCLANNHFGVGSKPDPDFFVRNSSQFFLLYVRRADHFFLQIETKHRSIIMKSNHNQNNFLPSCFMSSEISLHAWLCDSLHLNTTLVLSNRQGRVSTRLISLSVSSVLQFSFDII